MSIDHFYYGKRPEPPGGAEEVRMDLKTECELQRTNPSVTDTDELHPETCLSDLHSLFLFAGLILDSGACLLLAALNI